MSYIILDTETTGIAADDRIIQLAYIVVTEDKKEIYQTFCSTEKEIGCSAMAVHHITPEMLVGKPKLTETPAYQKLKELNSPENYMIIQNSAFDLEMLRREGFENKTKVIDTLTVARHLLPEMESHSEQFLRYKLGLYKDENKIMQDFGIKEIAAHDAIGDILVLKLLFDYLKERANKNYTKIENLANILDQNRLLIDEFSNNYSVDDQFYILSQIPILIKDFRFGKHKGKKLKDVVQKDVSYINWMLNKMKDMDAALRYSLDYYLGRNHKVELDLPTITESPQQPTKEKVIEIPPQDKNIPDDELEQPTIFDL